MDSKVKKAQFLKGRIYKVDDKKYLVDEVDDLSLRRIYGFQVDEEHKPYGRRRIIAMTRNSIITLLD